MQTPVQAKPFDQGADLRAKGQLSRLIHSITDFFSSDLSEIAVPCGKCASSMVLTDNYVTYSLEGHRAVVFQYWTCPGCGEIRTESYHAGIRDA